MKRLNKKGFTLIELLAVIVILAVVLGIAIPAVSQYITKSRKNGYVDNLLQFVDAARKGATLGDEYQLPVDQHHATIISFATLAKSLEKGGQKSSYQEPWDLTHSFVVIVNMGNADSPRYLYYVTASDGKYVTGVSLSDQKGIQIIEENTLKAADVIRANSKIEDSTILIDKLTDIKGLEFNGNGRISISTSSTPSIIVDQVW